MGGPPMRAIHSLAAPPRPPAPATVGPSPQRRAEAVTSPLRESSKSPPLTPPDLIPRRAALLALALVAAPARPAAAGFSLSIRASAFLSLPNPYCFCLSAGPIIIDRFAHHFLVVLYGWYGGAAGPKELLREQKKKSASYLLAPIAASRDTLLKAQALLGNLIFPYSSQFSPLLNLSVLQQLLHKCSFPECVCRGRRGGEGEDRGSREGLRGAAEELNCGVPVADWR